jgi:hypothetical protein
VSERKVIIAELKLKLQEYDELLMREHRLLSIARPSSRTYRSFFDYMWNEKPLCREEYEFVFHRVDMISLGADAENGWLEPLTDALNTIIPSRIMKVCTHRPAFYVRVPSKASLYS